jgi:hypothetical protein
VTDEEMGMFWRELEFSWWWYRAPIETQAVMIEAFDEVMNDAQAVEDCKVWLLKQKQTQDWKTTKATADAVYALLLRGTNLLASTELVQVTLGGTVIEPQNVEAGTGFYEQRFAAGEIKPADGRSHGQEDRRGSRLGQPALAVPGGHGQDHPARSHPAGRPQEAVRQGVHRARAGAESGRRAVKVGDELVVRIGIRVDRDMEYVHLKDHRGAGTEPVNVLSQYKYQDGWPTTNRPGTRPATSSSTTCPRAPTSLNTRRASSTEASTRPAWPTSSACTRPSSTATRKASR